MTMRIENREVVKQVTLLIPENETATFTVSLGGPDTTIGISYSDEENKDQAINLNNNNGIMNLIFVNWNNSLGTTTKRPVDIVTNDQGRTLSFMAVSRRLAGTNEISLQIMIG